jgi:hypothetical protein
VVRFTRTGKHQGTVALLVNGEERASLALPRTWWTYGMTAGLTCGYAGVPISVAYQPPYTFTAELEGVIVDLVLNDEAQDKSRLALALAEE